MVQSIKARTDKLLGAQVHQAYRVAFYDETVHEGSLPFHEQQNLPRGMSESNTIRFIQSAPGRMSDDRRFATRLQSSRFLLSFRGIAPLSK